ncbi:hypothetical protein M199_gp015 [Halogranum tailed virus 1]|uniref:Uncharacterized protein n=1 Tax=Halogranum tailed virus 1 TaxID=1273749 RepID=R4T8W8_9CAUD|nr:hypothetical protein M199_gp015 [Halogranum tailed virus 1]AGM11345.1 hypothetical protein HGTV1_15 [Halogranum tailed virus 1]
MPFEVDIDNSDMEALEANLKTLNIRSEADAAMEEVLEDEFIPFLVRKIESKGLVGLGPDKGRGPHLASEAAWAIDRQGNMDYRIYTIPSVSERAFYLEFGTTGPITPTDSDRLKFVSTEGPSAGEVIYPQAVSGVREYAFFREAIQEFDASGRLADKVGEDIADHIRNNLGF